MLPVCELKENFRHNYKKIYFKDLSDSQPYPKTLNNVKVAFLSKDWYFLIVASVVDRVCQHGSMQGCNARKVISEVYASFVLQCTVSGR